MAMSKPLREGISEFVIDYVQAKRATGEAIDAAEIAYEIAQSLIDIIMNGGGGGSGVPVSTGAGGTRRRIPPSEPCTGCWAQNCQLGCRPDRNQNQLAFFARQVVPTLVRSEQEFAEAWGRQPLSGSTLNAARNNPVAR